MKYKKVIKAKFISRPNRFIAIVDAGNGPEKAHVKNTGRCRELLIEGCNVYLSLADNAERKTKFDLVAVEKESENGTILINMDSQIPNDVASEWLPKSGIFPPDASFKREVFCGKSRFDFKITHQNKVSFLEVKGVTLEKDGVALFPDAPTERGVKHIEELISCAKNGMGAYILFVIQMSEIKEFRPNDAMHPQFGEALRRAQKAGVKIIAMNCDITPESISIKNDIPVIL